MTLQEPQNTPIADVDIPDTEVIVVARPSPVFVDSTGRRRRMLRRVAYGFGALCMVYGGLISVSLAGGPVSPSAVLPLPDLADGGDEDVVVARPSPTPEPVATRADRPVLEVFPRRGVPVTQAREARDVTPRSTAARRSPAPKPPTTKPKPSSTSPRPLESTTTKTAPSGTPTSTGTATPPVPPVPPVPPAAGTGGQGGSADEEPTAPNSAEPEPIPLVPSTTFEPADDLTPTNDTPRTEDPAPAATADTEDSEPPALPEPEPGAEDAA